MGMQNNRIPTPIPEELNSMTEKVIGKPGVDGKQQHGLKVWYDGVLVGEYVADLIVEAKILVELKAVKVLDEIHQAQCINYLRATGYRICLLINFGKPRIEVKRICL